MTLGEHAAHEAANRDNLESLKKTHLQEIVREILNILDSAVEPEWSAETIEHVAEVLTERNFLIRSPQDFED